MPELYIDRILITNLLNEIYVLNSMIMQIDETGSKRKPVDIKIFIKCNIYFRIIKYKIIKYRENMFYLLYCEIYRPNSHDFSNKRNVNENTFTAQPKYISIGYIIPMHTAQETLIPRAAPRFARGMTLNI